MLLKIDTRQKFDRKSTQTKTEGQAGKKGCEDGDASTRGLSFVDFYRCSNSDFPGFCSTMVERESG